MFENALFSTSTDTVLLPNFIGFFQVCYSYYLQMKYCSVMTQPYFSKNELKTPLSIVLMFGCL